MTFSLLRSSSFWTCFISYVVQNSSKSSRLEVSQHIYYDGFLYSHHATSITHGLSHLLGQGAVAHPESFASVPNRLTRCLPRLFPAYKTAYQEYTNFPSTQSHIPAQQRVCATSNRTMESIVTTPSEHPQTELSALELLQAENASLRAELQAL